VNDPQSLLLVALVVWAVLLVVGLGVYVWYAATLARVFARLGTPAWKAWVPVLNEAEILRLGGVAPWKVVFFLLPIVQFYGLYLKAVAASRINGHFGRGAGSTVLAILVPPVWSTLLARAGTAADPALQERIAPSLAERSGYAFAVSTPQHPGAPVPPVAPSGASPALPPAPPATPPGVLPAAPPAVTFPQPLASPGAALPPPPPPPGGPTPPPPGGPPQITPPPGIIVPPSILPPPPVVAPPAPTRAPTPPVAPASVPSQPWAPLDRPPVAAPPVVPAADPSAPDDSGDELDRTVVVDRRPTVPWQLIVDDGPTFRLAGSRVVLGRRPGGTAIGSQEIAVPDPTRTLSKVHARLDLADGVWTVTDLDATNGVVVIGPDGSESLLDPGASAVVTERFVLGKVSMRIVAGEAT
jgi:hypothetical protein